MTHGQRGSHMVKRAPSSPRHAVHDLVPVGRPVRQFHRAQQTACLVVEIRVHGLVGARADDHRHRRFLVLADSVVSTITRGIFSISWGRGRTCSCPQGRPQGFAPTY